MAATFYTMQEPMKRLLAVLPATFVTLLVLAWRLRAGGGFADSEPSEG